jgi:hypothetical protein
MQEGQLEALRQAGGKSLHVELRGASPLGLQEHLQKGRQSILQQIPTPHLKYMCYFCVGVQGKHLVGTIGTRIYNICYFCVGLLLIVTVIL